MNFNYESPIITALAKCFDAVLASVYFALCCLPVVTAGASLTAAYATMTAIERGDCGGVTRRFFGSFRRELRQATIAWAIAAALGLVLAADFWICWWAAVELTGFVAFMRGTTVLLAFLYCSVFVYLFAGISRFVATLRQSFWNAVAMSLAHPLHTAALALLMALMFFFLSFAGPLAFPVLVPGLYLQSAILNRVFADYIDEPDGGEG